MMNKKCIVIAFFICLILLSNNVFGQNKEFRDPDKRPKDFLVPINKKAYMKTKEYKKAHEKLEKNFWWIYEANEKKQILTQNKIRIINIVKSEKDFRKIEKARYWCAKNASEIIPELIKLLKDRKFIGLDSYFDLIIWERIRTRDMSFYGHGWVVADDLFLVAGRASWILREITGYDFGVVKPNSSPDELEYLFNSWTEWYFSHVDLSIRRTNVAADS